jgi:hypothetical protein
MGLFAVMTLVIAVLSVSMPGVTNAGGSFAMGPGRAFRGPSNSISRFPATPRAHRGFDRNPFAGTGIITVDPGEAVVGEDPAELPVIVPNAPPSQPPVADPKFVFPPAPSAGEPAGSHTVIVQRGSRIEVQSFPPAP